MIDRVHRLRHAVALLCMPAALSVAITPGCAAPEPAVSVDRILERYQAFLGGSALVKVHTRIVTSRRLEVSDTPADEVLQRASKIPMASIMHHAALDGSFVRYMNGCDAAGGWVGYGRPGAPDDGAPKPGQASTDGNCEQEQYYYGYLPLDLARMRGNVARFEARGTVQIVPPDAGSLGALAGGHGRDLTPAGPRNAYLVLSVPVRSTDEYVWLYFDVETGALLRRASAGRGPTPVQPGLNPRSTDFLQYREVGDGTKAPFQFVTTAPNSIVRVVETAITDNRDIPDSTFARPKDVRREDKGL